MRGTANGRSHPGSAEMRGGDRPQDESEHGTAQNAAYFPLQVLCTTRGVSHVRAKNDIATDACTYGADLQAQRKGAEFDFSFLANWSKPRGSHYVLCPPPQVGV